METAKIFISYGSDVENFVAHVCHCLARRASVEPYFHPENRRAGDFWERIEGALKEHHLFVFFLSRKTMSSEWQKREVTRFLELHRDPHFRNLLLVSLDNVRVPNGLSKLFSKSIQGALLGCERLSVQRRHDAANECAGDILKCFGVPFAPFDDLPTAVHVWYEKDLVARYVDGEGSLPSHFVQLGYPHRWPEVPRHQDTANAYVDSPLDPNRHGAYRTQVVLVEARIDPAKPRREPASVPLTFPEAGPRSRVLDVNGVRKVGILVSGGIAPGINAVISAIIERHELYSSSVSGREAGRGVSVYGYLGGMRSLSRHIGVERLKPLRLADVKEAVRLGGSVVPTSRADELLVEDPLVRSDFLSRMVGRLHHDEMDVLYVIGGEGSMRAAHALSTVHRTMHPDRRLSIVGVPKTMDNDILWVWQSFGFLSAVEQARKSINQLATEASSNPRLCVIQLFGSVSGFVVSHAALGSDVCDLALIPEMDFSMRDVCEYMGRRLRERQRDAGSAFGLVVMAETAIPRDFEQYMHAPYVGLSEDEIKAIVQFKIKGRNFHGQTPDELRSASLKIVSRVLERYIQGVMGYGDHSALGSHCLVDEMPGTHYYWQDFRVFTNEPRHIIRSMEPSVTDVAYGIRLGTMAVDTAMAGYTDCMVSQWLTEYVVVPLRLVVLGRKRMPREGIFWRTVVSKTGQTQVKALT